MIVLCIHKFKRSFELIFLGAPSRSRATAGRSILFPLGNTQYDFVRLGNKLAARVVLLVLLSSWKCCRWIIEQPSGSSLCLLPRFQWLWTVVQAGFLELPKGDWVDCLVFPYFKVFQPQAYTGMFYMGKYNGPTPKRHKLWSNDEGLLNEILAEAGQMTRQEMSRCRGDALVKKYTDKHGVQRYQGVKKNLKESQSLDSFLILQLLH